MSKPGLYKMSTVSERTGYSAALLRAWERRHGLLEPERTEGGHRLYTEDDILVLRRVRELLDEGRAIGELASLGRERLLAEAAARRRRVEPRASSADEATTRGWSELIVDAAVRVDGAAVEEVLDRVFAVLSPSAALERVVCPALVEIGERWAIGRCSVAGEHLASAKVVGRLLKLFESVNPPRHGAGEGGAPSAAIAACFPDELHVVGSLVAAYQLARLHYHVSYLGAALPLDELERSCELLQPKVVCLSVARPGLLAAHKEGLLEVVRRLPPSIAVLLGGRGAQPDAELERAGVGVVSAEEGIAAAIAKVARRRKR